MSEYNGYAEEEATKPWDAGKRPHESVQWFRMDPKKHSRREIGGRVAGQAEWLMTYDRARTDRYERYFQLYGGTRLVGIRPWENPTIATASMMTNRVIEDSLRLNVCKAAVDTITSKVGKLRPRPTFVTDHGDFELQLRAKKLQMFMDGAYHQSDAWELGADVFRDAMIFGTGVLHPYIECGKLKTERVPVFELYCDPADAIYGTPRCLYRVKWVSLDIARVLWPGVTDLQGPTATNEGAINEAAEAYRMGYVRVIEAWALKVGNECGAHALVVGGEVVSMSDDGAGGLEEWEYEEFPFCFLHWTKPVQGFWGDSAIREVVGIQVEINKLIQSVQLSMQLVGKPWVLRKESAVIKPDKIPNIEGQVLIVDSTTSLNEAVQVVTFQPVHPQVVSHIWQLYAKAFELLGSNQLAASATAPPGLESGRALEQLAEEHSERFMTVSRHFEYVMGEALARQFIRLAKCLDEELKEAGQGGYHVRAPGSKRDSVKLNWEDVSIDEDGFIIHVWPESVLPTTPAARTQHVQSLADAGWIDRTEARRLLNFPDLEAEDDLATADEDNLHRQLNDMLEHGKPTMPEPYQNLNRALTLAQQSVLRASADGVKEANIDLVRDFISAVEALLQRAQAAQQAMAAPAAPMPATKAIMPSMAGAPQA